MNTKKLLSIGVASAILAGMITLPTASAASDLTSSFSLDFEDAEYKVQPELYHGNSYSVVSNGDEWKASANWSLIKTVDGKPLSTTGYDGSWDDKYAGNTTYNSYLDEEVIFQGWGGSYTAARLSNMDNFTLSDKGDDVYIGLTSSVIPALPSSNQVNYDDVSVIQDPTNPSNSVLKLAPPVMENDRNTGHSMFGKNYVDVLGKQTRLSSKVYIDQESGGIRLMLVRDVDFLRSMQYSFNYNGIGKQTDYMSYLKNANEENGYWFDAVLLEAGNIYFNGETIGTYSTDTWYTVDYSLDLEDISSPYQSVRITDADGNVVATKRTIVATGGTSSLSGIAQEPFELSENAQSYGLILTATSRLFNPATGQSYPHWNGNRAQSGTVAYLDDIVFEERDKFALTTDEEEYIQNPVDFSGVPTIKVNFNYDVDATTVTNSSAVITDNKGNTVTPLLVYGENGGISIMLMGLVPSTVYSVSLYDGFVSTMGDILPVPYTLKFKTKDSISVKANSLSGTTAECTFTNNTSGDINGIFVFSIKKNGENVGSRMYFKPAVFPVGDKTVTIENIDLPADFSSGNYTAEGFLINSFGFLGAITDTIVFN